jgi:hypothetical protein
VAGAIYVLCAATSALCALLLLRGWLRTRTRLLLWSTACFTLLAVNNVLLVADHLIWTGHDLSLARGASGLAAVATLVAGLVVESR